MQNRRTDESPFFLGQSLYEVFGEEDTVPEGRETSRLGWAAARLEAHASVTAYASSAAKGPSSRRTERNAGMAEPWMAEIREHTLSESARSLAAIRDDRRAMRATEAELIRQNEQLESYGMSREQLTTNRRRLRILQVALRKKDSELAEARTACDAARARSASRIVLQAETENIELALLGDADGANYMGNKGAGRVGGPGGGQRPEPFVKRALLNVADRESTRLFPRSGVLANTHAKHMRKVTMQEPAESAPGERRKVDSGVANVGQSLLALSPGGDPIEDTEKGEGEEGGEEGGGESEESESGSEDVEDGVDGEERVAHVKVDKIKWNTQEELLQKMRGPAEAAFGKRVHWANLCEGVWADHEALAFAKAHPGVPRYNHQVLPLLVHRKHAREHTVIVNIPLTFLVEEGVVTWAITGDEVEETVERVPDLENLSVYELVEDVESLLGQGAWRPGFPAWVVKRFKPDGKGKALESASRVSSRATLRAPCRAPATLLLPAALVGSHTQIVMPTGLEDLQDVLLGLQDEGPGVVSVVQAFVATKNRKAEVLRIVVRFNDKGKPHIERRILLDNYQSYLSVAPGKPLPVERRLGIALEEAESFLSTEIRSLSDADPEVARWKGAAKKVEDIYHVLYDRSRRGFLLPVSTPKAGAKSVGDDVLLMQRPEDGFPVPARIAADFILDKDGALVLLQVKEVQWRHDSRDLT